MSNILITGIVAVRDRKPYIQIANADRLIAQLSMAEARQVAHDILVQCSRTEADAMIIKFFAANEFPDGARDALLVGFREFRATLDDEKVEHDHRIEPEEPAP